VIELATRKIEIAGITASPGEPWMIQIGRNLTEPLDGFLAEKRLLILVVRLPYRSPNLNAYAERFGVSNDSADCCASTIVPLPSRVTLRHRPHHRSTQFLDCTG
jgi:hypothetical protein